MSATQSSPSRGSTGRPNLAGVLYAEDFDDAGTTSPPTEEQAPEPELIEPVFTAAELEAARAEGRGQGRAEAERGVAASRVQVLKLIASSMDEAREAARQTAEQAAEATVRCMLTTLTACLPDLCARHGAGELRALIRCVLPALSEEPRITVRAHPHMTPVIEDELALLEPDIAERVTLQPSEAIPPGDARVTWSDGSASRQAARARTAVTEALAALGLLESRTLQPEMTDA